MALVLTVQGLLAVMVVLVLLPVLLPVLVLVVLVLKVQLLARKDQIWLHACVLLHSQWLKEVLDVRGRGSTCRPCTKLL